MKIGGMSDVELNDEKITSAPRKLDWAKEIVGKMKASRSDKESPLKEWWKDQQRQKEKFKWRDD